MYIAMHVQDKSKGTIEGITAGNTDSAQNVVSRLIFTLLIQLIQLINGITLYHIPAIIDLPLACPFGAHLGYPFFKTYLFHHHYISLSIPTYQPSSISLRLIPLGPNWVPIFIKNQNATIPLIAVRMSSPPTIEGGEGHSRLVTLESRIEELIENAEAFGNEAGDIQAAELRWLFCRLTKCMGK